MALLKMKPKPAAVPASPAPPRIESIDRLRGLDVLLMLFVNEMASVAGAPAVLLHAAGDVDVMTLADIVFPAFLFIVGLSVPFALDGRMRRTESLRDVWKHVLGRAGLLIVMGLFMVNGGEQSPDGLLPAPLWNLLAMLGLVAVAAAPTGDRMRPARYRLVRLAGAALLVALAFAFRREGGAGLLQMQPSWWGSRGLIGWAYLAGAALYLAARARAAVLAGALALLCVVSIAEQVGALPFFADLHANVMVGMHSAVVVAGILLALLLRHARAAGWRPERTTAAAMGYALALGTAGLLLHGMRELGPAFWISKINATAPWGLLAAAATAATWAILYTIVDAGGWRAWPRPIVAASENALLVYLVAPLLIYVFQLSALVLGVNPYELLAVGLWSGVARAVAFTFLVVWICDVVRQRGLRVQI
jgi:heparan-alpha-glucosaminide N-acetyltransferase